MNYWQINKGKRKNRKDNKRKRILEIWGTSVLKISHTQDLYNDLEQSKCDLKKKAEGLENKLKELDESFFNSIIRDDTCDEQIMQSIESRSAVDIDYRNALNDYISILDPNKDLKSIELNKYYISNGMCGVRKTAPPRGYYYDIIREFTEIKLSENLVKTILKRISFLLNLIKKRLSKLRDFRIIFNTYHSFHFKNLDDYYATSFNLSF